MVDKDKKPKTEKALGQDPFEGLFGPEWEEADDETSVAESTTGADQATDLPEVAEEHELESIIEIKADQATESSEAPDEAEPKLETTTEIDLAFESLVPIKEPEAETEPAVEDEDNQTITPPEITDEPESVLETTSEMGTEAEDGDELEPEFKALAEIEAAEIDQALEALTVAKEPEAETAPVAELEDEDHQTTVPPEASAEAEPELETTSEVEPVAEQAAKLFEAAKEPEAETAPVAEPEDEDHQTTRPSKTAEVNEDSNVLDEIIASIDEEIGQSRESDLMAALQIEASGSRSENLEQYIIFSLAGAMYAAPAANVREVGEMGNLTPVPNVPDWLLGVTNLRGDVLSVVDLHTFLSLEQSDYIESLSRGDASFSGEQEVLVVHPHEDALLMMTGLVVDEVNDIRYLTVDRITAPTAPIEDQVGSYLRGVYEDEDQLLVVLDFERLLLSPEMQQFEMA